jgi:hypothetical protein
MKKQIKKLNSLLTYKKYSQLTQHTNNLKKVIESTKSFEYDSKKYILDSKSKSAIKSIINSKFYFNQIDYFINEAKIAKNISLNDESKYYIMITYLSSVLYQNSKCNNSYVPYLFLLSLLPNVSNFHNNKTMDDINNAISKFDALNSDYKKHVLMTSQTIIHFIATSKRDDNISISYYKT